MNDEAPQKPTLLDRFDEALTSTTKWLYLLFAAAFVLKLLYVIQSSSGLHVTMPIMDSKYYDREALDIAKGNLIRQDAFFMGPLYPYLLAVIYKIFGRDFMIVRLIQMAGASLTVVLTYLVGKEVFRPSTALVGAALLALYGAITFHEGEMLMEWLVILINAANLYVLYRMRTRTGYLKYAIVGFLIGVSALARANILVFLPVVVFWALFVAREDRRFRKVLLLLATAALAIAPVTLHNYVAGKDFVLITSNGGVNFFIGNGEHATGFFYPAKGVTFETEETASRNYVERLFGRDMKRSEISRYWFSQAFEFIKAQPYAELRLLLRKTMMFFNGYEMPQIESFEIARSKYSTLRLLFVNFWTLASLGLFGIFFTVRSWRKYFLLYGYVFSYAFSIVLFFVTSRYRIQVAPILCLFAGHSLVVVLPGALRHAGRNLVPLLFFLLIVFFTRPGLVALPVEDIRWRELIHEARRLSELGKSSAALREINKAVEIHPEVPESYLQRAVIYKELGNYFKAIEDYSRALKIAPDVANVRYDLAQTFRKVRMYRPAIEEYEKAAALDPTKAEAYNNLGITYMEMGNREKAIECFKKVIELESGYIKAYSNLGAALAESGQTEQAIMVLTRAIRINPRYANSYKNLAMVNIQVKKPREAAEYLSRYLDLNPDDPGAVETLAKLRIAIEADSTTGKNSGTAGEP